MQQNVAEVYWWIVDDVNEKMQDVFAQEGVDATVLHELRAQWSRRLRESGALGSCIEVEGKGKQEVQRSKTPPVRRQPDVHSQPRMTFGIPGKRMEVPFPGGYYRQDVLWSTGGLCYPVSLPHSVIQSTPRSDGSYSSVYGHARPIRVANDNNIRFHPYTSLTTASAPKVRFSGKRKEGDECMSLPSHVDTKRVVRRKSGESETVIPQRDGPDDHLESQEPDLDDDSTLSDGDDEDEWIESSNCLTAQYDKVSRTKNRWKCTLKHGIFHVDGRDFLFKIATGEFTF